AACAYELALQLREPRGELAPAPLAMRTHGSTHAFGIARVERSRRRSSTFRILLEATREDLVDVRWDVGLDRRGARRRDADVRVDQVAEAASVRERMLA